MTGFDLRVTTRRGFASVRAYTTATPGLCVHRALESNGWVITHLGSTTIVAVCRSMSEAKARAADFGRFGDWTRPGAAIQADTECHDRLLRYLQLLDFTFTDPRNPSEFVDQQNPNAATVRRRSPSARGSDE